MLNQDCYARDFGAVGDGITDDGPALSRAFRCAAENGARLVLDENRTYLVLTAENTCAHFSSAFAANHCRGFSVDGCNSVIACAPGISYVALADCADFTFTRLHFDLTQSVYYIGRVLSVEGLCVHYETDTPVVGDVCTFDGIGFSIRVNEGTQQRPHRFFEEMRRVDDFHVTVRYASDPSVAVGDCVFLPAMDIGHMYGEPFYLGGCSGHVLFRNVDIWQAPSFTCAIKSCDADITFERFCLTPSPRFAHAHKMVAWRDGFHCKDNRGAIHWESCRVDVLFDDVFNISCTLGEITAVENAHTVTVVNQEFYRHQNRIIPYGAQVGDLLDIYDNENDVFCGCARVADVIDTDGRTTLVLDTDLVDLSVGCVVGNRMACAPDSTVQNCHLTGTMRFRGNCTIEDTDIDLLLIWIMVEGDVEGPIPRDIRFSRCVFHGGSIEVRGYNRPCDRLLPQVEQQITGIVFEDCVMDTHLWNTVDVTIQ